MRETLAALFLRACGYTGAEPVLDPMCGSGTFVIEAAEIAAGLAPGRSRRFAFERLASFDPAAWAALRAAATPAPHALPLPRQRPRRRRRRDEPRQRRARRRHRAHRLPPGAGQRPAPRPTARPASSSSTRPTAPASATRGKLRPLYAALGETLRVRFPGWRVGLVTTEPALARATGLPFAPPGPPVPHGPLRIRLYQTAPLP